MSAAAKRPSQLSNPDVRKRALGAAKRLRELPESPDVPGARMLEPAACEWLADLLQTLANRIPMPRPETARRRRGR